MINRRKTMNFVHRGKVGLHALTQHMAMELVDHNIRVNAVSPAVVKTPIYHSFIAPERIDEALGRFN
jgi:NAD(P)-dependent dehydrogenase (short-subunit alcohol dehydrogenase family)